MSIAVAVIAVVAILGLLSIAPAPRHTDEPDPRPDSIV